MSWEPLTSLGGGSATPNHLSSLPDPYGQRMPLTTCPDGSSSCLCPQTPYGEKRAWLRALEGRTPARACPQKLPPPLTHCPVRAPPCKLPLPPLR